MCPGHSVVPHVSRQSKRLTLWEDFLSHHPETDTLNTLNNTKLSLLTSNEKFIYTDGIPSLSTSLMTFLRVVMEMGNEAYW